MKTQEDILHSLRMGHPGVDVVCHCALAPGQLSCGVPHKAIALMQAHIARIDAVTPEDEEHAAFLRFHRAHAEEKLRHFETPPTPRHPAAYHVHKDGEVHHETRGPHLAKEHADRIGGHVRPVFDDERDP